MRQATRNSTRANILCSSADFSGCERDYVNDCLTRGWVTQGRYVRQFEERFANVCGTKHAVACSSGTSALHLALLALGVGPDDAVIVPALTYVATANAARYCGARVYFADVDPASWCMDTVSCNNALKLAKQHGCRRAVIIPVHLYDAICEVDIECYGNFPAWYVEDAAHAPGSTYNGHKIGSLGVLTCFSFYASKIIACGEGGAVVTDLDTLDEILRLYRGQGATTLGKYHHSVTGYNYRMTDVQAAIGVAQLERLPEFLHRRREIVTLYRSNLDDDPRFTLQGGKRASGWMFAVLLPGSEDRDKVADKLLARGIETRPFFEPLHTLPMYADSGAHCPIAESVARRGLCLPTHTLLTNAEVDYVCKVLREVVQV